LEYGYRLRLSAPQPDFELRVTPSTINTVNSANVPVTVTAIRRDGFAGDIALSLKDTPAGFVLTGGLIPAGQDRVRLTVTAPPVATGEPDRVRVEGRATINGKTISRDAVPADDRQQAFAYHHLVETDDLRVSVAARGGTRTPVHLLTPLPVKIAPGGKARIQVALPPAYQTFENIQFEISEPPEGITLSGAVVSLTRTGAGFTLEASPKATAGLRGNLIVVMSGERVPAPNAQGQAARRRVPIGVLPAIAFEITQR
jgi:hypothetical protein